jgi:Protein of unknown function (DUF2510)
MHEFDSVSVSTYEASSLADRLTEKSSEGWDVVAILPTGSDITAFLKRERASSATETDTAITTAAATATEPAGWGSEPAASASGWGSDSGPTSTYGTAASDDGRSWGSSTSAATQATTPTTPSTPNVPPGWYADPAGRYELRYWDGSAWTEHVSRAGQQYTDPPVA